MTVDRGMKLYYILFSKYEQMQMPFRKDQGIHSVAYKDPSYQVDKNIKDIKPSKPVVLSKHFSAISLTSIPSFPDPEYDYSKNEGNRKTCSYSQRALHKSEQIALT